MCLFLLFLLLRFEEKGNSFLDLSANRSSSKFLQFSFINFDYNEKLEDLIFDEAYVSIKFLERERVLFKIGFRQWMLNDSKIHWRRGRWEWKIRGSLWAFGMQVSGRLQPGSLNAYDFLDKLSFECVSFLLSLSLSPSLASQYFSFFLFSLVKYASG